jgi:hypothetical protein
LLGGASATTFNINGPNAGNTGSVTFTNVQNLTGGASDDTFAFIGDGYLWGIVDGGGGGNTLDYSAYNSGHSGQTHINGVIVNLGTGQATGTGGIKMTNSTTSTIRTVAGSNYNDILIGDAQNNQLVGGGGRDILIGRGGADNNLVGGGDDDILIGGSTSYDSPMDLTALDAIMAEWASGDSFSTRQTKLMNGVGAGGVGTGPYKLTTGTGGTVIDDGSTDTTNGGGGSNWIITS